MKKNIYSKRKFDLYIVIIGTLVIGLILIKLDAFELLTSFTKAHEEYQLDELFLMVVVGFFFIFWFSMRRYHENEIIEIERRKKDKLFYQQSKMVAMGEMIGNIAHQ